MAHALVSPNHPLTSMGGGIGGRPRLLRTKPWFSLLTAYNLLVMQSESIVVGIHAAIMLFETLHCVPAINDQWEITCSLLYCLWFYGKAVCGVWRAVRVPTKFAKV